MLEKTIIWKAVERIMTAILVVASALLVIIMGISVFMRYVLNSTLFGSEELLALLAIWLYWIGGAYGSYEDSHISADMTNLFIRNVKVRNIYKTIMSGVTTVISAIFAYWSIVEYGIQNIQAGTVTTALRMPQVYGKMAITVGLCLMFIYSLYHFIRNIIPMKEEGGNQE